MVARRDKPRDAISDTGGSGSAITRGCDDRETVCLLCAPIPFGSYRSVRNVLLRPFLGSLVPFVPLRFPLRTGLVTCFRA
jgi:hypothetical protein